MSAIDEIMMGDPVYVKLDLFKSPAPIRQYTMCYVINGKQCIEKGMMDSNTGKRVGIPTIVELPDEPAVCSIGVVENGEIRHIMFGSDEWKEMHK